MRHYEIVFLVHPDQSEQVVGMIDRYKKTIEDDFGKISRIEDWGRRPLSYPIKNVHKAHYVLMNISCSVKTLTDLKDTFRYNDAVIRHFILLRSHAIKEKSAILKYEEMKNDRNIKDNKEDMYYPTTNTHTRFKEDII